MQGQSITTNNIKFHVMTDGPENGTAVILLLGFPEFLYGWKNQIPALGDAGFRAIVPEQRGLLLLKDRIGLAKQGMFPRHPRAATYHQPLGTILSPLAQKRTRGYFWCYYPGK